MVSNSLCRAFDLESDDVVGKSVFAMGNGEWDLPRFRSLLNAVRGGTETLPYELSFDSAGKGGTRCLQVHAQKIDYDEPGAMRLMVAIVDLTEDRAARVQTEQLIADKILLHRELQHRVANSLQIIASVLMQSASRVASEETRAHLHQAHNRVLSIAEVQRQLASTGAETVKLKPYLTQLCESISASMVHDRERLAIHVEVDNSEVSSDASISLGLIVTELVINSLKHAFTNDRAGTIKVDYAGNGIGQGWMLEVADNGIGMPAAGETPAVPGLGTSIVEALVRQQHAKMTIASGEPGTTVSIHYEPVSSHGADVVPFVRAV